MTKNFTDLALAILRISFSGMMLTHGIPKLNMLADPSAFPDPLGVSPTISLILTLIAEVLAPIFVIIGFKTKLAAIPVAITMFVAAFIIHGSDPWAKKEMALLYLIAFVVIFLAGPGRYAIDGRKGR